MHLSGSAPRTPSEFRRAVTTGFRRSNPDASIVIGEVVRHGRKPWQPEGTVSFVAEVTVGQGGHVETWTACSFRHGGNVNHRVGAGSVSVYPGGVQ